MNTMNLHPVYPDFLDLMDAGIPYKLCRGKVGYTLFWKVQDKLKIETMYDMPDAIFTALRNQT